MAQIRFYNTIDSTNKEARRLLAEGPVLDGLTLFAHEQTDGKGQYGRTWTAEPGAHLTMTIIHSPSRMPIRDLPMANMKVTLGIIRALQAAAPALHLRIKWPNDIYAGDKKLCGILIENTLSDGNVQHMIIGIGVNINENQFPADLPNPVSLRQLTGNTYDLVALASSICDQVMRMLTDPVPDWKSRYDALIYGLGMPLSFESDDHAFTGIITGVDLDGRLHIRRENGEEKGYGTHEVKVLV